MPPRKEVISMEPLLERAKAGTPIVVGETATFVWHGERAPELVGDFTGWEQGDHIGLAQTEPGVWAHTLTLPRDAYLEYAFWQDGERMADPLNPRTTPDGFGHHNHYFYMPEAAPTPLVRRRRNVPRGSLARHVVENGFLLVGGKRTIDLYRPSTEEPCPLLVVLDGQDYRRRGKLVAIVDNLIAQGRIRPLAMALPYHAGQARGVEYACSEAHLAFLLHDVLSLAQAELNLVDIQANPGAYGVLGPSMGGLMALYAGLRAPHVFGHVLSQSGAFILDDYELVVWPLVEHSPVQPLEIWMDVGRYEWLLGCNQRMADLLAARDYRVSYREYNGGHNYPSWRDDVWRGLEWLFGSR
jgi:enterochelin esterase-like enzyme